jgi:hypothetical protein
MLLQEYQRFALECSLVIGKIPDEAPTFLLERILPQLKSLVDKNEAVHKTKEETITLRLYKLEIEDHQVTLLFQYADKNASDPSFTHTDTGNTRTEQKKEGEGISVSAHLIIRRAPTGKLLNTCHDAILEEVPGISRGVIEAGLTHMLSECSKTDFQKPDSKKPLQCRPKVSLQHNGNEKLHDLLKTGTISGFVAVKTGVQNALDEEGELVVADERLVLKVKRTRGQQAMILINKARDKILDRQYSRLQIRYQGDNKRSQTLDVGVREANIAEKMFAKSSLITFDEPIAQCQTGVHVKLKSKMIDILNKMAKVK